MGDEKVNKSFSNDGRGAVEGDISRREIILREEMGRSEKNGRAISAAFVISFAHEKRGEGQKGRSSGKTRE